MSSFCRWRIEPSKRITNKLIVINIPKDGCSWRLNNLKATMLLKNVEKFSSAVQYKSMRSGNFAFHLRIFSSDDACDKKIIMQEKWRKICHPLSLKIVLVFPLLLISCHLQYNRKYPICGKLTD
ncbi:hypothetical protein T4D_13018 [Trichinella pseudospiralis]|uniref:Uncharacterized protein n=1 Tax=Trichinella pseudospiralis TaxID=6337 RepID=A0A0V1FEZ0_TRIPS|nr:hypothetical protein T4D_13018 [Trichinella pseudospiralis]